LYFFWEGEMKEEAMKKKGDRIAKPSKRKGDKNGKRLQLHIEGWGCVLPF